MATWLKEDFVLIQNVIAFLVLCWPQKHSCHHHTMHYRTTKLADWQKTGDEKNEVQHVGRTTAAQKITELETNQPEFQLSQITP